jgi:hypothetical protein
MSEWTITGFSGINNVLDPTAIKQPSVTKTGNYGDVELVQCTNFDIDNTGGLIKRDDSQDIFSKSFDSKFTQQLGARTFTATGRMITYTMPFSSDVDPKKSIIEYDLPITMMIAIDTGMWVSTTDKIYFHQGRNPSEVGGFSVTAEYDFPAIMGTGERIHATKLGIDNDGFVVVFATTRGICYGTQTGSLTNLSEGKYSYKAGQRGISQIEERNGMIQYLVRMINQDSESYNEKEPTTTVVVDSQ